MERDINIDAIKIVAMFSVIALHSFGLYSYDSFFYRTGVIGIPLFFMSSGYLLLGRERLDYSYSLKKSLKILRIVIVISLVHWFLLIVFRGEFDLRVLSRSIGGAFVQKGYCSVCWFLGAMIIIYTILPLLNKLYCLKKSSFFMILITLFIVEFLVFIENLQNGVSGELNVIQTFRLWNWLFYFMLGGGIRYFIRQFSVGHLSSIFLGWFCLSLLVINYFFQRRLVSLIGSGACEYFYSSTIVIAFSIAVFLFVKLMVFQSIVRSIINFLSPLFLLVYLIHPFVISIISKLFSFNLSIPQFAIPYLVFITASLICVFVAKVLNLIPILRKIFSL